MGDKEQNSFDRDECFIPHILNANARIECGGGEDCRWAVKGPTVVQQLTNVTVQSPNARIIGGDSDEEPACEYALHVGRYFGKHILKSSPSTSWDKDGVPNDRVM